MRLSKRHMDDMYDMREIYINEDRYEHAFCIDSLIDSRMDARKGNTMMYILQSSPRYSPILPPAVRLWALK